MSESESNFSGGLSLLLTLRNQTAALHTAVESEMDMIHRMSHLDGYVEILTRFHGFYQALEPQIRRAADDRIPVPFLTPKSPVIEADLQALGVAAPSDRGSNPLDISLGFSELVGCLYVLEGSALGGQVIVRHLEKQLGLTRERGASFFGSAGIDVGARWRSFQSFLSSVEAEVDFERAVAGAQATFQGVRERVAALGRDPVKL